MKYIVAIFALFVMTACTSDFQSVEDVVFSLDKHDIKDCYKQSQAQTLESRGYFHSEQSRQRMDCTFMGNEDGMPDVGGYQKLLIDVLEKGLNSESVCKKNPDCSRVHGLSLVGPDSEYTSDSLRRLANSRDLWVFDSNAIIRIRTWDGNGMTYENRMSLYGTLRDDLGSRSSDSK